MWPSRSRPGPSGAIWAPTWTLLRPSWSRLGLQVGPRRSQKGAKLGPDGAQMAPSWHPKSIIFRYHFLIKFLNEFLKDLASSLTPILEVFGHPKRLQTASADFLKKCTAPQREHNFRGHKPPEIDEKSMQNRCGS